MIRRLAIDWPDARPFGARGGRPIRWLVVSDDEDAALGHAQNRESLRPLDAIVGCGDLEPEYLSFLGDAFHVPLVYVRGNHDRGGRWRETSRVAAPRPLASGRLHELDGVTLAALEWPGLRHDDRMRHDRTAWRDALRVAARRVGRTRPMIVISHGPPRGIGDRAADDYHVGFSGYRWLLDRTHPPLWLHGHVPPASVDAWRQDHDGTTVVNATGAVLLELRPPAVETGVSGHDLEDRDQR